MKLFAPLLMLSLTGCVTPSATNGSFTASWTHPVTYTDNSTLPVTAITQTRLEYGSCNGAAFGTKAGEVIATGGKTQTSIPELPPGTYCVRGYTTTNMNAESIASSVAQGIIGAGPPPATHTVVIPFAAPTARTDETPLSAADIARIDFELSSNAGQSWSNVGQRAGTDTSLTLSLPLGAYQVRDVVTDTSSPPLISARSPVVSFEVSAPPAPLAPPKPAMISVPTAGTRGASVDAYPRLGTYSIGGQRDYYTPAFTQALAKLNVVVLGTWVGWGASQHVTLEQQVQAIKAINPRTRVTQYVLSESLQIPANESFAQLEAKVNAENWWLYVKGTSGSKVLSDFGHDTYILNTTTQSRPDASGNNFAQWSAHYAYEAYAKNAPSLDGLYTDNLFWKPRRDGDWNLDATTDNQNSETVQGWFRSGYRLYLDTLHTIMPGKIELANLADWGQANAVLTQYQGQFDGGVLEHIIGSSWSVEEQSWSEMMRHYRKVMGALGGEKLAIFEQYGSITDYRAMRYGLASCLMDDAYYAFNDQANPNGSVPWFDEFDAKLGAALAGPSTSAWQSGVYRRDFENGIALVNPKGNGVRTVTLEADFVKIRGSQDANVNNGATVRTVTLQDRDGLLLLRTAAAVKQPNPPTGILLTPHSPAR